MQTNVFANSKNSKPSVAYTGDAGIDLRYDGSEPVEIYAHIIYRLPTGIYVEIPEGKCGIIFERSGLGAKFGVNIVGRIIDSGYRGQVIVLMDRSANTIRDYSMKPPLFTDVHTLIFNPGDKIAQMVIVNCFPEFKFVDTLEDLSCSERGKKGLGSSGK